MCVGSGPGKDQTSREGNRGQKKKKKTQKGNHDARQREWEGPRESCRALSFLPKWPPGEESTKTLVMGIAVCLRLTGLVALLVFGPQMLLSLPVLVEPRQG